MAALELDELAVVEKLVQRLASSHREIVVRRPRDKSS
jgi:hypothetical protein